MNKDLVKQLLENGWNVSSTSEDETTTEKDSIDYAIDFIKKMNFCGKCQTEHCGNCGRHNAKRLAIVALRYYQLSLQTLGKLSSLEESEEDEQIVAAIQTIEKLLQNDFDKAENSET
jgi:hypothetical protein